VTSSRPFSPGAAWLWRLALPTSYAAAVLGIYALQRLRFGGSASSWIVTAAGVLALVAGELAVTFFFELRGARPFVAGPLGGGRGTAARRFVLAASIARIALWIVGCLVAVEYPALAAPDLKSAVAKIWYLPLLGILPNPGLFTACVVAWAALVELIVIRRRVWRGTLFLALPAAVLWLLLLLNYRQIIPSATAAQIRAQPGVSIVFDADRLKGEERRSWATARSLIVDERAQVAWVALGSTLGPSPDQLALWRIDLRTGAYLHRRHNQIRALARSVDGTRIIIVPWHERLLYELDADTLAEVRRVDPGPLAPHASFEIAASVVVGTKLIIALSVDPRLLVYDLLTSRFTSGLSLSAAGLASPGDRCCRFAVDGAAPGGQVLVVLAGLHATRLLSFDADTDAVGLVATLDATIGSAAVRPGWTEIVASAEFDGALWQVDLSTHGGRRLGDAPFYALVQFDDVGDRIVLVDYLRGRLVLVDRQGRWLRELAVGGKPYSVEALPSSLWTASYAGLVRVARDVP